MIIPLAVSAAAAVITLIIASVQDVKTRTVYRVTWYPAAVIGIICAVLFWIPTLPAGWGILVISLVFAALMAAFAAFGLFGKADAKALILISVCVPITPFAEYLFPSAAVSALVNAGVLVLLFAAGCLIYNLIKGNRAPFYLMCSGFPVKGSDVLKHHGFIAEEVTETKEDIRKTFLKSGAARAALKTHSSLMIKTLRENPDRYTAELARFAKCDKLWITIGIPLILPITIGFIFALFGFSVLDAVLGLIW
ncbi:MAG TPA: prepilin peptidase [Methanocorpusculum sp.]|nr:prepilin peptidase [Methanocorpusculum sp.]